MDSLELNKIIAGVLGAILTLMLFGWVGDLVYGIGEEKGGYERELAYEIELPEGDVEVAAVDAGPAIGELLVNASAQNGEGLFRACAACHNAAEAVNKVGPYLVNVMGRDIASVDGFGYSEALASIDGAWTAEAFSGFIENPRGWAPGTAMGYNGMRKAEDRADIIAYLIETSGQSIDDFTVIPAATEEASAEQDAGAEDTPAIMEGTAEEAATEESATQEAMPQETAEELPSGAEGGVVAATPDTGPDTAVGQDDVTATDEQIETAPVRAPEAEDANTVSPETSEAIADENAPADEGTDAAPAEDETDAVAPTEEEARAPEAEAEPALSETASAELPAFMANADAAAGEQAFRACRACHVVDPGVNRTGPSLYNVVGRDIGSIGDYNYSSAMAEKEGAWTYENLNGYLEAPRSWLPGTKMGYAGMPSEQDRANLIAYLDSVGE